MNKYSVDGKSDKCWELGNFFLQGLRSEVSPLTRVQGGCPPDYRPAIKKNKQKAFVVVCFGMPIF
jgi:hypothetical protein